jgi:hypothetical protein
VIKIAAGRMGYRVDLVSVCKNLRESAGHGFAAWLQIFARQKNRHPPFAKAWLRPCCENRPFPQA